MNIFILDNDLKKNAEYYVDKHVSKMTLETAQLLCTAHHVVGSSIDVPYRKSHVNHPCAKWVRESLSNYKLLVSIGKEIHNEFQFRYQKIHKSGLVIDWAGENLLDIPDIGLTPYAQAMPDQYKVDGDAVTAYRQYYIGEKSHIAKWSKREKPEWFVQGV